MKLDFLKAKDAELKPIEIFPEYEYKLDVDALGNEVVVVDHEKDIQAEINSYCQDCNIYQIMLRHEAGDLTALNAKKGYYATEEMVEAAQALVNGQSLNDKLYQTYKAFGVDSITFDKFAEMVSKGQYDELLALKSKKEEVTE